MTEAEHDEESETTEPEEDTADDGHHNLPGTPDENAEGLVDGVAEGQ
jgi:hypothetical protein